MSVRNPAVPERSAVPSPGPKHRGQFVELMFSGFGHVDEPRVEQAAPQAEARYRPLPQSRARPGATYRLQSRTRELPVKAESPASDVMTDLSRVEAVTISPSASVDEAHQTMISRGVRLLFVIDDAGTILGLITSTDILGERPIQIAETRGLRHADIFVREVMTPAALLEAIELQDVLGAHVGDIVETLKRAGRQHALVIDSGSGGVSAASRTVRGILSLTQIERQLGLPPRVGPDVGHRDASRAATS